MMELILFAFSTTLICYLFQNKIEINHYHVENT